MIPTDLVTGGSGFIGRWLCRALLAEGRGVRILDLAPPPEDLMSCDWIEGSITDVDAVARAVEGARHVYHVAGNPQLWARRGFDSDNRVGAEQVLRLVTEAGARRIVLTSTHAINVAKPNAGLNDMPGPYTRAKFAAEQAARALITEGAPISIVAPTLPIGPDDPNLTPPNRMLLEFVRGKNPAYLQFQTNLIDVREVAAGHILAARKGETGARYVLGRHNMSMSDLMARLRALGGTRAPRRSVPYPVALLSAWCMEGAARFTGKPPRASIEGVRLASALAPVPEEPAAALGLEPWPLDAALQDTLDWLEAAHGWR